MANKILSPLKKALAAVCSSGLGKKNQPGKRPGTRHAAAARPVPAQPCGATGAAGEERGEAGWCSAPPFPLLPMLLLWELGYCTAAAVGLAVPQFPRWPR